MYIRHGAVLPSDIPPITEGKRLLDVEGCEAGAPALHVIREFLTRVFDLKYLENWIKKLLK